MCGGRFQEVWDLAFQWIGSVQYTGIPVYRWINCLSISDQVRNSLLLYAGSQMESP